MIRINKINNQQNLRRPCKIVKSFYSDLTGTSDLMDTAIVGGCALAGGGAEAAKLIFVGNIG
jgi:hypothetical protein